MARVWPRVVRLLLLMPALLPGAGAASAQTAAVTNAVPAYAPVRPPVSTKARSDVARFRARVDAALAETHAQRGFCGILVVDQDTGATLFELNADHFFEPASNAKVFTSAFALATLGEGYKYRTTLESNGALGADGHLSGDLILVGRGDPNLSNRKFPYAGKAEHEGPAEKVLAELADAAVAQGLKAIDGDVVADDSYFPYDPYPAGWNTGDLYFAFGAPVSAIAFNDNSFTLVVAPGGHAGDAAVLSAEPAVALGTFGSEITTAPADAKPDFAVVRRPGTDFILVRGLIPLAHEPMRLDFALTDPANAAGLALKQLLEARGVVVAGTVRVKHAPPPDTSDLGDLPPPAESAAEAKTNSLVLAEHLSPPLIESVRVANKASLNLHAELFLRTISRARGGAGSTVAALKLEQDFFRQIGVADGDVVLSDGSGLAHDDLVTPRAVVQLLGHAAQQAWGQDYQTTLPIAGVDGTLENRMKGTSAAGVVRAKTGGLEHVRALSGYATTLGGAHLVFSILNNNSIARGRDATATVDAIVVAMVETLGPERKPRPKARKKE